MNVQACYLESQTNPAVKRQGGVILKGAARTDRQPVHLLFLIDTSGSMEEEHKLENVKKSMNFILPFLTEQDLISLITFDDDAKIHITRQQVSSENKQALEYKIQQMRADGSTNLSAGLLTSRMVFEQPQQNSVERKQGLIVLTDGYVNIGVRDETQLLEIVRTQLLAKIPGLSLTTIAYGATHNSELLSKMSIEGGGSYNIVKNLEDVASVFGEILGGLLSVSAQMIEVHFPPDVEVETVYPKEVMEGGITRVRIGDLYAEAEQTLLFRSAPEQGPIRITGVSLPSFDPVTICQEVELLPEGTEPNQTLKMADFRNQVSKLLREVRQRSRSSDVLVREAEDLKLLLESSSFHENMLVQMMLDDLRNIIQVVHRPANTVLEPTVTSQMAQHETYLSCARGLRSPTSTVTRAPRMPRAPRRSRMSGTGAGASLNPQEVDSAVPITPPPEAEEASPVLSAQTSIFSNDIQRRITGTLRTMSQQPEP